MGDHASMLSREKSLRHGLKSAYVMAEAGYEDAAAVIAQSVVNAYREADSDD